MMSKGYRWGVAAGLAASALPIPVRAQLVDQFLSPNVSVAPEQTVPTVTSRQQADYAASGTRVGGFVLRPLVNVGAGYESNVLGTPRAQGSSVLETKAALEAASNLSRVDAHALLTVDDVRYFEQARQSYTSWTAQARGAYDFGRDTLSAQASHAVLYQTARDLDTPLGLDGAIAYRVDTGDISYKSVFNRLTVTPAFEVAAYDYDNGTAGGVFYPQRYRDRTLLTPSITVAYEQAPGRNVVGIVRDTAGLYSQAESSVLPKRDYNDVAALGGVDLDLSGVIRLRALLGYERRSFEYSAYQPIQGPVAEASATWRPTLLTTIAATVSRRITDSADDTTAGLTRTAALVRIEHEYSRDVLLFGNSSVAVDNYRGSGDQTLYQIGVGGTYLLSRRIGLTLGYDFLSRDDRSGRLVGNLPAATGYNDHRILLQVRLTL